MRYSGRFACSCPRCGHLGSYMGLNGAEKVVDAHNSVYYHGAYYEFRPEIPTFSA